MWGCTFKVPGLRSVFGSWAKVFVARRAARTRTKQRDAASILKITIHAVLSLSMPIFVPHSLLCGEGLVKYYDCGGWLPDPTFRPPVGAEQSEARPQESW